MSCAVHVLFKRGSVEILAGPDALYCWAEVEVTSYDYLFGVLQGILSASSTWLVTFLDYSYSELRALLLWRTQVDVSYLRGWVLDCFLGQNYLLFAIWIIFWLKLKLKKLQIFYVDILFWRIFDIWRTSSLITHYYRKCLNNLSYVIWLELLWKQLCKKRENAFNSGSCWLVAIKLVCSAGDTAFYYILTSQSFIIRFSISRL